MRWSREIAVAEQKNPKDNRETHMALFKQIEI